MESQEEKRLRKLTERATAIYEDKVAAFTRNLCTIRQSLEESIIHAERYKDNNTVLNQVKGTIHENYQIYDSLSSEFQRYLITINSTESNAELYAHNVIRGTIEGKISLAIEHIEKLITANTRDYEQNLAVSHSQEYEQNAAVSLADIASSVKGSQSNLESENSVGKDRSNRSVRSRRSTRSSNSRASELSDLFLEKKTKAEAAKAKLKIIKEEEKLRREQNELELKAKREHAETEATIEKQRMDLASSLSVLKCKREVVEAEAELNVIQGMIEDNGSVGSLKLPSETSNKHDMVKDFVQNQIPDASDNRLDPNVLEFVPQHGMLQQRDESNTHRTKPNQPIDSSASAIAAAPIITDLTKYIMKKDLLLSRLSPFDDRPERYLSWKNGFRNVLKELEVSPTEELDLLSRWLGPESRKQAASIRVSNAHDERIGLERVWQRLDARYGAPEQVAESLRARLDKFPKVNIGDREKLYELADLLAEINSIRENEKYKQSLAYFDSSYGVNSIVNKLPGFVQNKWVDHASQYKSKHAVMYPPFGIFVEFVNKIAIRQNDPSFRFDKVNTVQTADNTKRSARSRPVFNTKKTNLEVESNEKRFRNIELTYCVLHGESAKHNLKNCRVFLEKPIHEKREIIQKNGICYKCLNGKHLAKDCHETIKCNKCSSARHCTAFHIERSESSTGHGGEQKTGQTAHVDSRCTEICEDTLFKGKSCAKTVLVRIYAEGRPQDAITTYVIIDDQSNKSLARSELFDRFSDNSESIEYILSSCAGSITKSGRRASGFVIESFDGTCQLKCPPLLECNEIPDNKQEIATPAVARQYHHLRDIEHLIPEVDKESDILILLGRDLLAAHHVLDQKLGTDNEPYAQRLRLGWVIVGETCLGMVHHTVSEEVSVHKTNILYNGRASIFEPCLNVFEVKDEVFQRTAEDEVPGLSREDRTFLKIMETEMSRSSNGKLKAPLPFRETRSKLPNNYKQAKRRAENLVQGLKRDHIKQEHFLNFMKDIFANNQAEEAPPAEEGEELWYLPIFGVYHPKKPSKIRVVFDSAAKYDGICLNDTLLKGPDLTNNLEGVLLNFRRDKFAATADVEQMFFNFEVLEKHRNFLRFLWFKDNDPTKQLVEYRMRVHVFGNSPSPAIATYGIRQAVCNHQDSSCCDDVCEYVKDNFYVDDALVSRSNESELSDLIKRTQKRLHEGGNIRLHKIVSNSSAVLNSFPTTELAKDITEIDFSSDSTYVQRSLGLSWDVVKDTFTYRVSVEEKPYTKRGLLSTINGLFDPLGFVAPVILGGRLIMREAIHDCDVDWDDKLPEDITNKWRNWQHSLAHLEQLQIPRSFTDLTFTAGKNCELHVFSDASKEAIAAVAYIRSYDSEGKDQVGFVLGKSKLAPRHGHTIPRLELCAAVVATELATFIQKHLAIPHNSTYFYTDSQVVLGYINNESRRFYVYVANRVDRILKVSSRNQWSYVPTNKNPADDGTRPVSAENLASNKWLTGPETRELSCSDNEQDQFKLVEPNLDKEVCPVVDVKKVEVNSSTLGSSRFQRFSSWSRLVLALSCLKQKAASCHGTKVDHRNCVELKQETEMLTLKEVQKEVYSKEIECLRNNRIISRNSSLVNLSPVLDSDGLLRIGGRLKNAKIETGEKAPIIIPGKHHIATLLVRHYHELVVHQGRHLTEGAIRTAGYWITGGKRLISSILHKCVKCRKLRRPVENQKMSDLPTCRLTPSPPFTYVGVDTFGPWSIVSRRTRGGMAHSKRWAIMFSCLNSRAVHIEIVEDMSSSSFINALRRFISIRGNVREFFSDRGTNFVGAVTEMGIDTINVEDIDTKRFLNQHGSDGSVWRFNAPHSSHMSGSWERMIGLARRILESMLCSAEIKNLTHEVLSTLMAEVMCIINSRPITAVSDDPSSPTVLSPNVLLTQKVNSDIEPFQNLDIKDMYKSQWRLVQVLANQFWKRWRIQYLQGLQTRKKWQNERPNIQTGDVVLMMDSSLPRIQWPIGVIESVFPSLDGLVRKISVRVIKDGKPVTYTRPITQLIHLLSE